MFYINRKEEYSDILEAINLSLVRKIIVKTRSFDNSAYPEKSKQPMIYHYFIIAIGLDGKETEISGPYLEFKDADTAFHQLMYSINDREQPLINYAKRKE